MKHTQRTLPDTPIVLSGDANVWWPEFHLGRERPRDRFVFPYIRELLEACGLSLRNPLRVPRTSLELRSTWCSFRRSVLLNILLFTTEMVVALSAHLGAQRSDLITFYVTSLFLRYLKVIGMHRAQPILFQLSEIGNQYFLLPVENLILGLLQCRSPLQRMSLGGKRAF